MSEYAKRPRFETIEEAEAYRAAGWPTVLSIRHITRNEDDGTFSVLAHINCEFCDYCEEGTKAEPHLAKENPYERQEMYERESEYRPPTQEEIAAEYGKLPLI